MSLGVLSQWVNGISVLFFIWELCMELGFNWSEGIQNGLKEQVICCLEDKQAAVGELEDQGYGQPSINVPETYLHLGFL